ncbi:MAG: peptidoglycan recognition family protein [Clostridia bacterium]
MDITKYLTTVNYAKGTNKQNLYIVIHYTANNGDTALNNAKYFNTEYRGASAHYFIDENEIVQVVDDADTAWHCGATSYTHASCRNVNSIGIEMCSRKYSDGTYYIKDEVVNSTISLVKYLMSLYNIPSSNVVRHYDVTGKTCPAPMVLDVNLWEEFLLEIDKEEEDEMRYNQLSEVPSYAKDTILKMIDKELLKGSGTQVDEDGYPADLDLSIDMIRVFVTMDRVGVYD